GQRLAYLSCQRCCAIQRVHRGGRHDVVERFGRVVGHQNAEGVMIAGITEAELNVHGFTRALRAEQAAGWLEVPVVELTTQTRPRVLRLPNQHTRVPLERVGAEALEQRAILSVVGEL